MKVNEILLIALYIALNGSTDPSKEDCNNSLNENDKKDDYTHCCYVRYKKEKKMEQKPVLV